MTPREASTLQICVWKNTLASQGSCPLKWPSLGWCGAKQTIVGNVVLRRLGHFSPLTVLSADLWKHVQISHTQTDRTQTPDRTDLHWHDKLEPSSWLSLTLLPGPQQWCYKVCTLYGRCGGDINSRHNQRKYTGVITPSYYVCVPTDVDECPADCPQVCVNTRGSYLCFGIDNGGKGRISEYGNMHGI